LSSPGSAVNESCQRSVQGSRRKFWLSRDLGALLAEKTAHQRPPPEAPRGARAPLGRGRHVRARATHARPRERGRPRPPDPAGSEGAPLECDPKPSRGSNENGEDPDDGEEPAPDQTGNAYSPPDPRPVDPGPEQRTFAAHGPAGTVPPEAGALWDVERGDDRWGIPNPSSSGRSTSRPHLAAQGRR
jgi:hypothetical protein